MRCAARALPAILPGVIRAPPGRGAAAQVASLLAVLALLLAQPGCSHMQPATGAAKPLQVVAMRPEAPAAITMYVARRAWHIDVGFATGALAEPLSPLTNAFPGARFLMFGFGDRRYLHARHPWLPEMITALWPGDGLVLVTALQGTPQQAFGAEHVVELTLSEAQLRAAQQTIAATLLLQEGVAESDGPGPYEGSEYLRASLRYSAVRTCNTWAAEVIKSAGQPVHTRGVVFAGQLWRQLQRAHTP
jgi:hypothetical protein